MIRAAVVSYLPHIEKCLAYREIRVSVALSSLHLFMHRNPTMKHEIKLMYGADMPKRSALAYCRKMHGPRFCIAIALLILWASRMIAQNHPDWLDGAILGLLGIYAISTPLAYVHHYRNSMQKLHAMANSEATLGIDDATITFTSSLGATTIPWISIKEIWQFNGFWLFIYYNASYNTIPLAAVSAEQRQFLIDCVEKHGGKVS
jgi:hypothetical protein